MINKPSPLYGELGGYQYIYGGANLQNTACIHTENLRTTFISPRHGFIQRRFSTPISKVHIRPGFQQNLHTVVSSEFCSHVERRCIAIETMRVVYTIYLRTRLQQ